MAAIVHKALAVRSTIRASFTCNLTTYVKLDADASIYHLLDVCFDGLAMMFFCAECMICNVFLFGSLCLDELHSRCFEAHVLERYAIKELLII